MILLKKLKKLPCLNKIILNYNLNVTIVKTWELYGENYYLITNKVTVFIDKCPFFRSSIYFIYSVLWVHLFLV